MPNLFRLQRYIPASLLFIQAAQQQIHLMVKFPIRVIPSRTTLGALAFTNRLRHVTHRLGTLHFPHFIRLSPLWSQTTELYFYSA